MPIDQYEDDEEGGRDPRGLRDFDCPSCSAHNPLGEPVGQGEEVLCNYCGSEYQVTFTSEGRLRLRET
jgi:hypothetical protein